MTDPTERSRPIPAYVHDILTDKPTAYLATMRPDGAMSVTPMGMLFDGTVIRLSTTKDRKKYRNLLADDRLTVDHPHVFFNACAVSRGQNRGEEKTIVGLREPAHGVLLLG